VEKPGVAREKSRENTEDSHVLEGQGQRVERAGSIPASQGKSDDKSIEESPAPGPTRSVSESVSSPMKVDSRSPSYSPVLDRTLTTALERDDDYEPPDATPSVTAPSVPGSPPFSPAPPDTITGDALENNLIALEPAANDNVTEAALTMANGQVVSLLNEVDLFRFLVSLLLC
jgi:hypothetical protein